MFSSWYAYLICLLPTRISDNFQAIDLIYLAQLVLLVGCGAYGRSITAVVGGQSQIVWLTASLVIVPTVLGPPISQAADYWGRKWFLVVLTAFGIAGTIVVSRANSIGMAIAGFSLSGFSFSAQPLVHAVPSEVLPRKWRPWAQASINIFAAVGGVFGLLVGGQLTRNGNNDGFRPFFYITAAIYAVATVLCAVLYNPPPRDLQKEFSTMQKLRQLDWIGYGILICGLVLFSLGLSWAQNPYPWTSANVLAPFLVGSVLAIIFILYESLGRKDGMVHHGLFKHRNFALALVCIFVEGVIFFAANNYFAFEVSVLGSQDPLVVGLHYSVMFYVMSVSALGAGVYCSWRKSLRGPLVFSFACFLGFNGAMTSVKSTTSPAVLWGLPALLGAGVGISIVALLTVAQLSTPPALIAIASGLMISIRSLGASVAVAIYNAIFNHTFGANLAPKVASATLALGLPESSLGELIAALLARDSAALGQIDGVTPEIIGSAVAAVTDTYVAAFRNVWVSAACFSVVPLICKCAVMSVYWIFEADCYVFSVRVYPGSCRDLHIAY